MRHNLSVHPLSRPLPILLSAAPLLPLIYSLFSDALPIEFSAFQDLVAESRSVMSSPCEATLDYRSYQNIRFSLSKGVGRLRGKCQLGCESLITLLRCFKWKRKKKIHIFPKEDRVWILPPQHGARCEGCVSLLTHSLRTDVVNSWSLHSHTAWRLKGKKTGVTQCVELKVSLSSERKKINEKEKERGWEKIKASTTARSQPSSESAGTKGVRCMKF